MRDWELDPQTQLDLRAKGVIKDYGTGDTLLTPAMPLDKLLLIPNEEIGKMPVRERTSALRVGELASRTLRRFVRRLLYRVD